MKKGLPKTSRLYFLLYGLLTGVFLAWGLWPAVPAHASTGINQTINFQGRLLNSQGATVADGFYNIEFKIYQDGDGQTVGDTTGSPAGTLKWTEDYLNANGKGVKVVNGYLSVQLGSVTAFGSNIDWNQDTLWLSMNIGGTGSSCSPFSGCSPDGEMVPMQPLTSAPYAFNSGKLGGLSSSQFVQLGQGVQSDATTNSSIYINKTASSGNLLQLQKSNVDVLSVSNAGSFLLQPTSDSATAFLVQNHANGYAVLTVDTSGNQVILGKASSLTGKLAFATAGGGTLTINPTSSASNFTITFPGETGTVCTTAASGTCNTAGGLSNVAYLNQDQSFTNKNTFSLTGSGANSYVLGVTGTPAASSTSSLIRVGNAITGGNGALNGGTYLSVNEPSSGAGSAADFLNLQNNGVVQLQLTSGGNLTVAGTYNSNTFTSTSLAFGGNGAATISSNGSNNLTLDTGSSGGTETLGNNATTTNIGSSNAAHTINIGSGGTSTTQAVTIGSATNTSSSLTLQGGNGSAAISLQTGNNGTTAGGIQIGNVTGAFGQTINIGTNATASASNIVNIGTAANNVQDSVTIGSTSNANSTVNINAGSTGGINLGASTLVTANNNVTYSAGTGKFDAHSASGTFDTTSGANSLNGDTTVTGTKTFTVNGGLSTLKAGALIQSGAAGTVGTTIQGASGQTAALLQLQDSGGTNLLNVAANGDLDQLGNTNTPFGGLGTYGNLILQSEQLGTTWTATNINVTQNDGASNPAPDTNTTADKLVSTASGTHTLTQAYSSAGNNTYTFSIWLKAATPPQAVQLRIDSDGTPASGTAASFNVTGNWQRYVITQTFTSGVSAVSPTLVMVNNNASVVGWGAQLILGSSAGVYVRSSSAIVAAGAGLISNGTSIFQAQANNAIAYQFQNASGADVATIDTTNGQVVLGTSGASGVTGQIKFNYSGQTGSITLAPNNPSSTAYTINLPAENGTICTTAASGACSTAGSGYVQLGPSSVQADATNNNSIFINKTSGTGNIFELQKSGSDVVKVDNSGNLTATGQATLSRNSSGAGDYTLGVTGTPAASSTSSLLRIGGAITGGNGAANGGTYLGINEPGSGAGSAADFLNLQNNGVVQLQLTSGGNLTVAGTYNTNTFTSSALTFGASSAATISSNGSNNLTLDTGSSGGTETLGNNAATTNIGTSNAAHTINIGSGGSSTTQAVTIGSATNTSSTLTLQGGNGSSAILLQTGNNGGTAGGIQIGNTSGAFNQTITIANNNSAANTVNIGTGTSQDSVTIGNSTNANSSVTLSAGSTGKITLGATTNVSANSDITYLAGSGKFDAHNATGTFDTSTGANSLNGNTGVTGTNTFTVNGGLTTLNGASAGSSQALKINTNAVSNVGVIIQGASSQSAALLQLQDTTTANLLSVDASGNQENLGYINTPSGGFGSYGNLLVRSEDFATTWNATNVTVTANDGPSNPAPDGNTTADKLVSSASGTHTVTQTYSSAGNNTYTFSVWVKTNSSSAPIQLRIDSNGTPASGTAASFTAQTTWQRFSVSQTFTSGVTTITPTIVLTNNNSTVVAWGAQLVQASSPQVYTRTVSSTVAASNGLVDNGTAIFQAANSTVAFQVQNASATNFLAIDTTNNTVTVGNGSGATAVNINCGTGTCGIGNNATDHSTTVGSTTGTSATTVQSGSGGVSLNGNTSVSGSNTFATGTGAVSLNGDTTVASGKNFSQSGGGTFSTGSGANTLNGDTTVAGSHTFTTGTGNVSLNGNTTVASNKSLSALGDTLFKDATNSASAFQVQNNSAFNVLAVDTSANHLKVYDGTSTQAYVDIYYDDGTSSAIIAASTGTTKIGNGTGAVTISAGSGSAVNITGHAASTWQTDAGGITIQGGTTLTLLSTTSSTISLDSGTTGAVNVGTGANAKTVTLGNSTGASAVTVDCGTGNCKFGATATDHSTTVGSTTGTSATTIQSGTGGISLSGNTTVGAGKLFVEGTNGSDLTCTNGGIYYNTGTNRFRGCENGTWINIDNFADIQSYTSGDNTWTKPVNVTAVQVILVGGGGGGGGGGARNGGQERNGGGGGGGGAYASQVFNASDLASTAHAAVGAAGSSGAGAASSANSGSNGGAGAASCFSSAANCTGTIYTEGYGGGGGSGGGQAGSAGGAGGGAGSTGAVGATPNLSNTGGTGGGPAGGAANASVAGGAGAGGGSSSTGTANAGNAGGAAEYGGAGGGGAAGGNAASGNGGSSLHGAGGGGAGGSTNSGNSTGTGGAGGVSQSITNGGGGAAGTAGAACTAGNGNGANGGTGSSIKAGSGGGGGGANGGGGGVGCPGGTGGAPGGAGGGGGSGSGSAGAGGAGAAGEIWVISW